jgi:ABC-type multidrug transport system permease subunit
MKNQNTKTKISPETCIAYIMGSLIISALVVALAIAAVHIFTGNVHIYGNF